MIKNQAIELAIEFLEERRTELMIMSKPEKPLRVKLETIRCVELYDEAIAILRDIKNENIINELKKEGIRIKNSKKSFDDLEHKNQI